MIYLLFGAIGFLAAGFTGVAIEEFAEAECMGDLSKIGRNHGYIYEL